MTLVLNSLSKTHSRSISTLKEVLLTAAAKSLQSCPTLRDPIDGSPPGSSVPGILQARILEWVNEVLYKFNYFYLEDY